MYQNYLKAISEADTMILAPYLTIIGMAAVEVNVMGLQGIRSHWWESDTAILSFTYHQAMQLNKPLIPEVRGRFLLCD